MIENNSINYEKKYKLLCKQIEDLKKSYNKGKGMNMEESVYGESACKKILEYIGKIDKKYPTE